MLGTKADHEIDSILKTVFGKAQFRPVQREVILAALDGHDVFLQAATSFGKSLCFQLPAVVNNGVTIVISPLLALMTNQITALHESRIPAASLNSTTPPSLRQQIITDLTSPNPVTRLLYVTPELCALPWFRKHLITCQTQSNLSRVVVDEAHCISSWGHDFRPSFTQLSWFKLTLPKIPVMCVTATATAQVRADVLCTMGISPTAAKIFLTGTARPNLHLEVRYTKDGNDHFDDFLDWLLRIYSRRGQTNTDQDPSLQRGERPTAVCGIIYTHYRRTCTELATRLTTAGVGAKAYHAGLSTEEKADRLRGWAADEVGYDVIVATTAFGMGIDKGNVRFVVHWGIGTAVEGWYQEMGRAGRDGRASIALVYYSREDRDRGYVLVGREMRALGRKEDVVRARAESFQALVDYCEASGECRHRIVQRFFHGKQSKEEVQCEWACDYCKFGRAELRRRKIEGLADEEWVSTQRERGRFDDFDFEME